MTTVTFIKQGKLTIGYEIKGHSGYSVIGSDIVCAAISTISQATEIGIVNVQGLDFETTIKTGDDAYHKLMINDRLKAIESKRMFSIIEAQPFFETMQIVCESIAVQYKNYVKVCTTNYNDDIMDR